MIKYICDRCLKEVNRGGGADIHKVQFPCHIAERQKHDPDDLGSGGGYVDGEGNAVSGRMVDVHLCNKCYNEVMGAAWAVMMSGGGEPQTIKLPVGGRRPSRK